jgi:cytochrome c biogenesis protein CcdA
MEEDMDGNTSLRSKLDTKRTESGGLAVVTSFAIPAVLVTLLLILLVSFRGGIENSVASLARLLPVGYAFAAGMVASVNPCGILMLSTYVFYQLRDEGATPSTARQVFRSLVITAAVTLGFVAIFAIVGGAIAIGGQWLVSIFPYAGLAIGIAMAILGVWLLLTKRTLAIGALAASRDAVAPARNIGNNFLFGIAYAVASLSCTLPVFLVVVASALASDSAVVSFGQFIGYGLGMGAVILVVTVGAALFRRAVAKWIRVFTPHVYRLNAMFLIGAGAYLIYYWLFQGNGIS